MNVFDMSQSDTAKLLKNMLHLVTRTATATLLCIFIISCSVLAGSAEKEFTHECGVFLDWSARVSRVACKQLSVNSTASQACRLLLYDTVYFNYTTARVCTPATCNVSKEFEPRQRPTLWAPGHDPTAILHTKRQLLKPQAPTRELALLYFQGGPSCNVHFVEPWIVHADVVNLREAELCKKPNGSQGKDSRHVLVVGGGMRATFTGGRFQNNTARMGVSVLGGSKLAVRGTLFTGNRMCKGALYGFPQSDLQGHAAAFCDNRAGQHGGAVFLDDCAASFSSCRFTVNMAGESGGAFHVKHSTLTVSGSNFSNNTAPTGGALAIYDSAAVIKDSCVFNHNNASQALQSLAPAHVETYYKLGVAGAIYSENSNVTISSTQLRGNKAVMNGGAILVQAGHVNVSNCSLLGNYAHRDGGAFYVDADKGTAWLHINNTILRNNTAEGNGGGLYVRKRAHVNITNSMLEANKAWNLGGALCTDMDDRSDHNKFKSGSNLLWGQDIGNISVDATFSNNTGLGFDLFVGPDFELLATAGKRFDLEKEGIRWFRRKCDKGEYLGNTLYCNMCPPNTYLLTPGTHDMQCQVAPKSTALAPGGAVLVPLSSHWHGSNDTVKALSCGSRSSCPTINVRLSTVIRCPNPDACQRGELDVELLAQQHPNRSPHKTWNHSMLEWEEYGQQLCTPGYSGLLCGTCQAGYGQTAPFKCVKCLEQPGQQVPQKCGALPSKGLKLVGKPDRQALSGLWALYWIVLTLSTMFGVWSAMHQSKTTKLGRGGSNSNTGTACSSQGCSKCSRGSNAKASQCSIESPGDSTAQNSPKDPSTGPNDRVLQETLAVWKVLSHYMVLVRVVVSLPITFQPWAQRVGWLRNQTSQAQHIYRLIFGGPASADCLLQSWGLWTECDVQAAATNAIMRALISAVLVPIVLWLSAVLLHMAWRLIRPIALGCFIKAAACWQRTWASCCGNSQLLPAALAAESTISPASALETGTFWGLAKAYAVSAFLVVFFAEYQTVAQAAMALLSCVEVDKSWWWVMDVRLRCPNQQPHVPWAQGAMAMGVVLLVWCLVVPLALGGYLAMEAQIVSTGIDNAGAFNSWLLHALAYRYADYNVDDDTNDGDSWVRRWKRLRLAVRVAWDSVIDLLLRLPLSAVVVWVTLHELLQLLLVAAILGVYLLLMVSIKPWKSLRITVLQIFAIIVLMVSCLIIMGCGLSYLVAAPSAADIGNWGWADGLVGFAGAIVVAYFVFLLGMLIYTFVKEVRPAWNKAKSVWDKVWHCVTACFTACCLCLSGSANNQSPCELSALSELSTRG